MPEEISLTLKVVELEQRVSDLEAVVSGLDDRVTRLLEVLRQKQDNDVPPYTGPDPGR